jgi:hypothetical protein
LKYLKNNDLINKGYVNFAFDNTSTLLTPLSRDYDDQPQGTESDICSYYSASNFDIIMETTSDITNRCFITEKTTRALALGQPFVTFNGPGVLAHLRSIGFKTYQKCWDESYDTVYDPAERFKSMMSVAHTLIDRPSIFKDNPEISEIGEHNKYHFQKVSQKNHRLLWFER